MSSRTRVGTLPLELLLLSSLAAVGVHADTITLNSTSSRIQYQGSWSTGDDFRVSLSRSQTFAVFWGGKYSPVAVTGCGYSLPRAYCSGCGADDCFCDSSGTGIRVQGRIQGNESAILFSLDNNTTPAPPQPDPDGMVFAFSGLGSGDHQLLMSRLPVNNVTTNFFLYNIILERDDLAQQTGTQFFDPSRMGTTASGAPSNAVVVDDSWPGVRIDGKWTCWATPRLPTNFQEYWYNNTATETSNEGDSLKFMFYGPSIWVYGTKYSSGGESDVYVDGNKMGVINSYGYEVQDLLWSTRSLSDSKHELQIKTRRCPHACLDCGGACLSIDFFQTLSSPVPDIPTTTSPAPSPTDNGERDGDFYDGLGVRNASAIIAGVVGGTLFVLLTSLGTFAWKRLFALS